jgi:polyisoprenoid-binding protein YceI
MTSEPAAEITDDTTVAHYRVVPGKSRITVQAFAEGLFSAFGHDPVIAVRDFSGEAQFVPGTFQKASAKVVIDSNSLVVIDKVEQEKDRREIEDRMRREVLESDQYPEIIFTSNNISVNRRGEGRYRARIIGDLTLHGVTQKNLWISAELSVSEASLSMQGEFSIKQTDYKIKLVSVAGGTLKVKNEVKCAFDVAAQKEE